MLKKDHEFKGRPDQKLTGETYEVYVGQVQGRQLKNAIFKRRTKGNYDVVARSSEAELHVNLSRKELIVHMRHAYVLGDGKGWSSFFDNYSPTVPLPAMDLMQKPSPRGMTWQELFDARRDVFAKIKQITAQRALVVFNEALNQVPTDLHVHQKHLQ